MSETPCPACQGMRLKKTALAVTVGGINIADFCKLSVFKALEFIETLELSEKDQMIAERIGTTQGRLRQAIDVALVLVSVVLTLIFRTEWTLREGTVIAALIFGPAMDFWRRRVFARGEK